MSLRAALRKALEELPRRRRLSPVTVAVVDSGIDATHPDLAGRVIRAARAEVTGQEIKIVEGRVPENADVYGHGTAVASIITQIAPNARLLDIRVLDEHNVGSGMALLAGFRFAIEQKARVVNMSLAARAKFADALHALCENAYRQNQVVVAARRNMPLTDNGFPAEFSSAIGVDMDKFPSLFKIRFRGDQPIQFVANGEDVRVAAAGGGHTTMTGTSFATPAVSGLCALLIGAYPDLYPFDLKAILRAFSV